jgi:hypothetical protein
LPKIAKSKNQEAGTTTAILAILAVLAITEERLRFRGFKDDAT